MFIGIKLFTWFVTRDELESNGWFTVISEIINIFYKPPTATEMITTPPVELCADVCRTRSCSVGPEPGPQTASVYPEMPATEELSSKLERRLEINTALDNGIPVEPQFRAHRSIYAEFTEFTRKQIKEYEATFNKWVLFSKIKKK